MLPVVQAVRRHDEVERVVRERQPGDVADQRGGPVTVRAQVALCRPHHVGGQVDPGQAQVRPAAGQLDQQHARPGAHVEHVGTLRCGGGHVGGEPAVPPAQQPARGDVVQPDPAALEPVRRVVGVHADPPS